MTSLFNAISVEFEIQRLVVQFSDYLDSTYPADISVGERLFRRTTNKLAEELGEVGEAVGGWIGENPRKGVTHGPNDVLAELMDVAACALGAAVHVCRAANLEPDVVDMLLARLVSVTERAGLPS